MHDLDTDRSASLEKYHYLERVLELVKELSQPQPRIDPSELSKWRQQSSEVDLMLQYRKQIDESAEELSQIKEHVHKKRKAVERFEHKFSEEARTLDGLKAKRDRLKDLLAQPQDNDDDDDDLEGGES